MLPLNCLNPKPCSQSTAGNFTLLILLSLVIMTLLPDPVSCTSRWGKPTSPLTTVTAASPVLRKTCPPLTPTKVNTPKHASVSSVFVKNHPNLANLDLASSPSHIFLCREWSSHVFDATRKHSTKHISIPVSRPSSQLNSLPKKRQDSGVSVRVTIARPSRSTHLAQSPTTNVLHISQQKTTPTKVDSSNALDLEIGDKNRFNNFSCHLRADGWINKLIDENRVVIFSKSYCVYCTRVKELFKALRVAYQAIEIDHFDTARQAMIKEALYKKTGMKSWPNIFINRQHLGGYDKTVYGYHDGSLHKMLNSHRSLQPLRQ